MIRSPLSCVLPGKIVCTPVERSSTRHSPSVGSLNCAVTGIKALEIHESTARVRRQTESGWERGELPLPAVVTVKEGLNLPRYPSLPGRLKAKKKPLERLRPKWPGSTLEKVRLKLPSEAAHQVQVLGRGPAAAARAVDVFRTLGILDR